MIVSMEDGAQPSLEQIQGFLDASQEVRFEGKERKEVYEWVTRTLRAQDWRKQGKNVRGLLRRLVLLFGNTVTYYAALLVA